MGVVEALVGATVFDGETRRHGVAVLVTDGRIAAVLPEHAVPAGAVVTDLGGGLLTAGFIDAQVNGGGGVMLNDGPTADAMAAIARAHRPYGTTALLPTLITDTPAATAAAIAAAIEAAPTRPGVIGLHLEGPHLAPARRGAHVAELMRPLTEADADQLVAATEAIGVLMVTVAVEQAPPRLIRRLADGGVVVSLGHTDATYDDVVRAVDAGARGATHLFNAMSPLGHRAPGMAGAALDAGSLWCGLIADGHHVHPATLGIAIRGKRGPGRCFLVTDAMSTVGTEGTTFLLNGRTARRENGRLTLDDGTLAGADIDMAASVRLLVERVGVDADEALRMASAWPADYLGIAEMRGRIRAGLQADLVHLSDRLEVKATWIAGERDEA
ncbi:N-acetylglucosamine-6-phosphate deacetylase [Chthonobacter rhizosphaerae]|uniref:N-acetylglucosamine-6-phosphate deacetylase n=1 Tax=Chthonobacter rhizosphaerae TaxID=2735553 RepID=UPI0015EF39FB|nr:N-acetylglucosamine-6-phosphate deacetylase [Chthonobacter rhizosphaerae]